MYMCMCVPRQVQNESRATSHQKLPRKIYVTSLYVTIPPQKLQSMPNISIT